MGHFAQIAKQETTMCRLFINRTKLKTEDVINRELTIIDFDFAPNIDDSGKIEYDQQTGEVATHGVIVFAEMPDKFYHVGSIFTKICRSWMSGFESAEDAGKALSAEGGVRVRFFPQPGRRYTNVEILG